MSPLIRQTLFAASLITVGANVFGRLLGFLREAATAGYYGTSALYDLFVIAFTVPELISFIAFAALPPALIPWMRRRVETPGGNHPDVFWPVTVSFALIFGLLSLGIYLLRDPLVLWLGGDLPREQLERGAWLVTLVAGFVFFRGMEAVFRAFLFDRKHFVIPGVSPLLANVIVIGCLIALVGIVDIDALAWGWLGASALLFVLNGLAAHRVMRPAGRTNFQGLSPLLRVALIIAVVESFALIYPVIDRYLAAQFLGVGEIAALRYATFLVHLPTGMFVVSFASVSFPWISDLSGPETRSRLLAFYSESISLVLFGMAIVAAAMVIFPLELTAVAFRRGAFDAASLHMTAGPFAYLAAGILFYSVYIFQMRFYYARGALGRLTAILGGMVVLKAVLSALLVGPMNLEGLALATSLTWLIGCLLTTVDLSRTFGIPVGEVFLPIARRIPPVLAAAVLFWLAIRWSGLLSLDEPLLLLALKLIAVLAAGCGIYALIAYALKFPEPRRVVARLRAQFSRSGKAD